MASNIVNPFWGKHFRTEDGTLLKVVMLGYHWTEGTELLVLKEIDTGKNWFVPSHMLHEKVMVEGVLQLKFTPDTNADDNDPVAAQRKEYRDRQQDLSDYPGDIPGDMRQKGGYSYEPMYRKPDRRRY